jgi:hypothetical protein
VVRGAETGEASKSRFPLISEAVRTGLDAALLKPIDRSRNMVPALQLGERHPAPGQDVLPEADLGGPPPSGPRGGADSTPQHPYGP